MDAENRAEALLELHVAWIVSQLQADGLAERLEPSLDTILANASQLTLSDVVDVADIRRTAVHYAADMRVGGAIPALVGDIARAVYTHPAQDDTPLETLLSDRQFEEWLDKVLEMDGLREAIASQAVANPVYADLVAELIYAGLQDYMQAGSARARRVPGAGPALGALRTALGRSGRARRWGDARLAARVKALVRAQVPQRREASERHLRELLDSPAFRQAALEFWSEHKHLSIARIRDLAGELDVEELFVIGYEYWRGLRRTEWYRRLIETGVDVFYENYRDVALTELLEDIGVTRDMILADLLRFLPPVVAALQREQMLEPAIRQQLEGFYRSEAVAAILR